MWFGQWYPAWGVFLSQAQGDVEYELFILWVPVVDGQLAFVLPAFPFVPPRAVRELLKRSLLVDVKGGYEGFIQESIWGMVKVLCSELFAGIKGAVGGGLP